MAKLRVAPSIRQSELGFIPTPDDLDGEFDRKLNIKPTLISDLPDGGVWAERFIILALEVMAGARPIAQLSRWCSRKVFTYLIENIHAKKTIPKIGKLHIGKPTEECMEVVLLLHSPARKRALVARFEALDGR
ncbi:MAG: Rv3235 family protein, partial [Actinobacteria bacterium]|nr:Rv3235 family protein [Actinomycetota bacterium]